MTIVAVVPARGGSKGFPGKNLAMLGGRTLVEIAVTTALMVEQVDEVLVSSEDERILEVGMRAGASALHRPFRLAQDETTTLAVVRHAAQLRSRAELISVLQPTSPLRQPSDVQACLDLATEPNVSSVATVTKLPHPREWEFELDHANRIQPTTSWEQVVGRRQDSQPIYALNGAVYVIGTSALLAGSPLVGPGTRAVIMPAERSIDIDTEFDLELARALWERSA